MCISCKIKLQWSPVNLNSLGPIRLIRVQLIEKVYKAKDMVRSFLRLIKFDLIYRVNLLKFTKIQGKRVQVIMPYLSFTLIYVK